MSIVAVDVETATPDLSTICQTAIVTFAQGSVVGSWQSLVDPQDDFAAWKLLFMASARGTVLGTPTIPALAPELYRGLTGPSWCSTDRVKPLSRSNNLQQTILRAIDNAIYHDGTERPDHRTTQSW